MLNTITLPNATVLNINKKQQPFQCSFTQIQPCERFVLEDGTVTDYWHTFLELKDDLHGRIVGAVYTEDGKLASACTVN